MKRIFYIALFAFLGVLVATLAHAAIEIPFLAWMSDELELRRTHWLTENWYMLHAIGGKLLWLGGAVGGYIAGRKFWHILYVEKRYGTPRW